MAFPLFPSSRCCSPEICPPPCTLGHLPTAKKQLPHTHHHPPTPRFEAFMLSGERPAPRHDLSLSSHSSPPPAHQLQTHRPPSSFSHALDKRPFQTLALLSWLLGNVCPASSPRSVRVSGSQAVAPRPAAPASPGSLLETPVLIHSVRVYQIITSDTSNTYNSVCPVFLSEIGGGEEMQFLRAQPNPAESEALGLATNLYLNRSSGAC